jgi:SAM-dependent methyltransferase
VDEARALPAYSERHLDPAQAVAYRGKFERSLLRRLSHRRELWCVRQAVDAAFALLRPFAFRAGGPVLLDLPCGAGRFAPLLAARAGAYLPADHSPHMLALCRDALAARGLSGKARESLQADARRIPLADQSVDLACCLRLLHHFPRGEDRAAILGELRRVDQGPLVLTFLDAESPKQWIHLQSMRLAGGTTRRALLSRAQLSQEAHAAGWELVRTWAVSGLFSGQTVALLRPSGP